MTPGNLPPREALLNPDNWVVIDEAHMPRTPAPQVFPSNAQRLGVVSTPVRYGPSDVARWTKCPAADLVAHMRKLDAQALAERAQWLNWVAFGYAQLQHVPFTPYHAASKARRTLRFSQEHKS